MVKGHDPRKPVRTKDELKQLLLDGLDSGAPEPFTREDWDALRRRALANTEVRKSGLNRARSGPIA